MSRGIECATWGAATRDGEVKESKAGNLFGLVNLAVNEGETVSYVAALLFGGLATEAGKIKSGDRCYVEGTLQASLYEGAKGPRINLTVKAFKFHRTAIGKNRERPPKDAQSYPQSNPHSREAEEPTDTGREFDDEMPF
jgi:single-stranded DNA-binding protein